MTTEAPAQHTPGPWRVDPEFLRNVITENGIAIATTAHMAREHRANAALIAEAPVMLEMLREAHASLTLAKLGSSNAQQAAEQTMRRISATIRKATSV